MKAKTSEMLLKIELHKHLLDTECALRAVRIVDEVYGRFA